MVATGAINPALGLRPAGMGRTERPRSAARLAAPAGVRCALTADAAKMSSEKARRVEASVAEAVPSRREVLSGLTATACLLAALPSQASDNIDLLTVTDGELPVLEVDPLVVEAVEAAANNAASGGAEIGPEAPGGPLVSSAAVITSASTAAVASTLAASFSSCCAEAFSFPVDTAKVRLQLQAQAVGGGGSMTVAAPPPKYRGTFGTMRTIISEEGLGRLYAGLPLGLQHQILYSGMRLAIYAAAKDALHIATGASSEMDIAINMCAGLLAGGTAILVANPTDVVRTRLQADGEQEEGAVRGGTWVGQGIADLRARMLVHGEAPAARAMPVKLPKSIKCYFKVVEEEGIKGLWAGVGPNVVRSAVINSVELAAYDFFSVALAVLVVPGLAGGHLGDLSVTVTSAAIAGFMCALVCSPVDVLRSQVMHKKSGDGEGPRAGMVETALDILRKEGPGAFYKGVGPFAVRLAIYDVVLFVTLEQCKSLLHAAHLM